MYLINTLYFKSMWKIKFEEKRTATDTFMLANGKKIKTTFMSSISEYKCLVNENEAGVLLPYDDDRFAFLVYMPGENIKLSDYIRNLNESTIKNIINKMKPDELNIILPKFEASYEADLIPCLRKMGLDIAFTPGKADFSKMGYCTDSLYIGKIKHKTFLKLDESGTEAGAATSTKTFGYPKELRFNRPFLYAIIDVNTNLPVFIGAMYDPR